MADKKVEQDAGKRIEKEKALQRAKKLEKEQVPTAEGELEEVEDFMKESEHAKNLLKPAWFLEQQKKRIEEIPAEGLEDYLMYKYLMAVRTISLLGYFTSEKIGKEVLNFDPIPGVWKPCIPVEEVGNVWTI